MRKTAGETIEHRAFPLTIKSLEENGTFSGYLSVFGNEDLAGDVVQPGAFTKTLKENTEFPLLWMHDMSEPIGVFTAVEDAKGLFIDGSLILDDDVPMAKKAYKLMKGRALRGLSMGVRIVKKDWNGPQRLLQELALMEGSVTPIGMNLEALVTAVKSAGGYAPHAVFLDAAKAFIPTVAEDIDPNVNYWVNMAALMRDAEVRALLDFKSSIWSSLSTVANEMLLWNGAANLTDEEKRDLFAESLRIFGRYMMTWFDEVLSRMSGDGADDIKSALAAPQPETPTTETKSLPTTAHASIEPQPEMQPRLPWNALHAHMVQCLPTVKE